MRAVAMADSGMEAPGREWRRGWMYWGGPTQARSQRTYIVIIYDSESSSSLHLITASKSLIEN